VRFRTAAALIVSLAALALGAYVLVPVPLSAKSLANSVERETGSGGVAGRCSKREDDRWRCTAADPQGSGSASYEVTADGGCWRARRSSPEGYTETPMPRRAEGCTRLRDRYPLLSD
jgi:hypothetical protein